jgi:phospholipase/carboxylesterase
MSFCNTLAITKSIEDNLGFWFCGGLVLKFHLKESPLPAKACVIWMHGLGADASDMAGLAAQLPLANLALRHVFIDAPVRPVTLNAGMLMRAWYDILGMQLTSREDKPGILTSQNQILEVIQSQLDAGFTEEQIVLAGFSQGGAMALRTALHCKMNLAGVIALSSYLPLAGECQPDLKKDTPIFMGYGQFDPLVLPDWTLQSSQWLAANNYQQLTLKRYPMEHSICMEEINDVYNWLNTQVLGVQAL